MSGAWSSPKQGRIVCNQEHVTELTQARADLAAAQAREAALQDAVEQLSHALVRAVAKYDDAVRTRETALRKRIEALRTGVAMQAESAERSFSVHAPNEATVLRVLLASLDAALVPEQTGDVPEQTGDA